MDNEPIVSENGHEIREMECPECQRFTQFAITLYPNGEDDYVTEYICQQCGFEITD